MQNSITEWIPVPDGRLAGISPLGLFVILSLDVSTGEGWNKWENHGQNGSVSGYDYNQCRFSTQGAKQRMRSLVFSYVYVFDHSFTQTIKCS